jgi:hypothetical protein
MKWEAKAKCASCGRPYGDENGFPDLIIPNWAWRQISPTQDLGGLLCPSCIIEALCDNNIKCPGAFMSGPIETTDRITMENLRWIENLREQS